MDGLTYNDDTIICYCSDISFGEIRYAVENGSGTVREVRDFLGKHTTGNCIVMSPYKKCCHELFNDTIDKLLSKK